MDKGECVVQPVRANFHVLCWCLLCSCGLRELLRFESEEKIVLCCVG